MVSQGLKTDDLVWAKMKNYPFWPGKIINAPANIKLKKASRYVFFYGTNNCAWVVEKNIVLHSDDQVKFFSNKKKSVHFQKAVHTIVDEYKIRKKSQKFIKKINVQKTKRRFSTRIAKCSGKNPVKVKRSTSIKKKRSPKKRKLLSHITDGSIHRHMPPVNEQDRKIIDLTQYEIPHFVIPYSVSPCHGLDEDDDSDASPIPVLDLSVPSATLIEKHITPTVKKIGFVGLGMMGQRMVKNLLNSGHYVMIWNRSPEKCDIFYNIGAHAAMTPADIVANCDIIFCCVSDSAAVRCVVFGNYGILAGLDSKGFEYKGYVEMSCIDPVVSQEISEAITSKGAKYLEAPVNGSLQHADEGTLFIFAAGDKQLFMESETCLHAMSRYFYYFGPKIGTGFSMSLIMHTITGTACAALAEAMALIENNCMHSEHFLQILALAPYNCELFVEKGQRMCQRNFNINNVLRQQQNNLNMTLELGNVFEQPMSVTAAANELYKRSRYLGYAENDISAVLLGIRY